MTGRAEPRRTAAERLIATVADDVDVARYDPSEKAYNGQLLRLASEKRGLEVVRYPRGFVALQGERAVLGSSGPTGPSTTFLAAKICGNKPMTLRLLRLAGVPVPDGRSFGADEADEAIEYATGLGWPVVLKPSAGSRGKGVVIGIESDDELRAGWEYAVGADTGGGVSSVIVEREHDGVDVRVYVVGGEGVAGTVRLPAYVRGDGRSTVEELVSNANRERLAHPMLRQMPILLDEETDRHLAARDLAQDSVPDPSQIVLLRRTSNIFLGGVNVDVTDELPAPLIDAAVRAVEAIPGMDVAAVDFVVPEIGSADGAVALEVNSHANIWPAHFPVAGEPRDVAGAIVDQVLSVPG